MVGDDIECYLLCVYIYSHVQSSCGVHCMKDDQREVTILFCLINQSVLSHNTPGRCPV